MALRSVLAAGACIAVLAPLTAQAASVQPTAGFYRSLPDITAATPTAACAAVGVSVGYGSSGFLYYPGPNATGAVNRTNNNDDSQVIAQIFPKTPAAGAATWSGTSTEGVEGSKTTYPIPFTAKITYLTTQSFSAVFTSTLGTCKATENIVFIKSGN